MSNKKAIRILTAILLSATGLILVMMTLVGLTGTNQSVCSLFEKLGFSLIVAGIVSLFHEIIIRKYDLEESAILLSKSVKDDLTNDSHERAELVAKKIYETLQDSPLARSGIRIVSQTRKGWEGYYRWAISTENEPMFFAGRSVLHRIDQDLRYRNIGRAEEILARKLHEGSQIRIMILDPRSDLIPRLAEEEGQTSIEMLSDIAFSIGICERLYNILKKTDSNTISTLDIRFYNEVPYFAYHRVNDLYIVGFYFQTAVGHSSAAYELLDLKTRQFFAGHFDKLFQRAERHSLLRLTERRRAADFDRDLLANLKESLRKSLGDDKLEEMLKGEVVR